MKNFTFKFNRIIIGVVIGLGLTISLSAYASTNGTIGDLFQKIGTVYKLFGTNIVNDSIESLQIKNDTITEVDIIDTFKARDSDKLDGIDSSEFMRIKDSTYDGIADNSNDDTNWIRTTVNGLIPYTSGGSSYLGTSGWPFQYIYGNNIIENGVSLVTKYMQIGSSGDNIQDNTIDSTEIEDNTITSSDILDNTIFESDISDSFKARDSDLLDGKDSVTTLGTTDLTIPTSKAVRDFVSISTTTSALNCVTKKTPVSSNYNGSTLYCDVGYIMTGGGCFMSSPLNGINSFKSYPNGNGWYCSVSSFSIVRVDDIWVRCCN